MFEKNKFPDPLAFALYGSLFWSWVCRLRKKCCFPKKIFPENYRTCFSIFCWIVNFFSAYSSIGTYIIYNMSIPYTQSRIQWNARWLYKCNIANTETGSCASCNYQMVRIEGHFKAKRHAWIIIKLNYSAFALEEDTWKYSK